MMGHTFKSIKLGNFKKEQGKMAWKIEDAYLILRYIAIDDE